MLKGLGLFFTLILTVIASTACMGQSPNDVAADFAALLDDASTSEDVYSAESFLLDKARYLNKEQTGELLLLWEDYANKIDNSYIDYTDIINKYKTLIPDYMQTMFQFKDIEQKSPIISEASLLVSWSELLDRTIRIEDYISENLDHPLIKDDILWLYGKYMHTLLIGASNTPVFDYKTSAFSEELRSLIETYITRHPDGATSQTLAEYYKYLESVKFSLRYDDKNESAKFFETCNRLKSEAEKRVFMPGKDVRE